ncbi:MAG: hypothetical protein WBK20_03125 [Spirochaetota bacterium]
MPPPKRLYLPYLAGAKLDYHTIRDTFKEVTLVGFIGFLPPFAGCDLIAYYLTPLPFIILFGSKVITKISGLYPVIGIFKESTKERWYYILLMSTRLTFGSISALFGLTHNIID